MSTIASCLSISEKDLAPGGTQDVEKCPPISHHLCFVFLLSPNHSLYLVCNIKPYAFCLSLFVFTSAIYVMQNKSTLCNMLLPLNVLLHHRKPFVTTSYICIYNNCYRFMLFIFYSLARFRCSAHILAIEKLRYRNQERNNRICQKCNLNMIENEYHFLMICPFYLYFLFTQNFAIHIYVDNIKLSQQQLNLNYS